MGDIKSIILGDEESHRDKTPTAPVVQKEEMKSEQQPNPVEPLPISKNGYAQAAAQVNVTNDAIQNKAQVDKPKEQVIAPTESVQPKIASLTDFTNEIYRNRMPSEEELVKP